MNTIYSPARRWFPEPDLWLTEALFRVQLGLWHRDIHMRKATVSTTPHRGKPRPVDALGTCESFDGPTNPRAEIWVAPEVAEEPVVMLGVLVHECLHASLPVGAGHGLLFVAAAERVGLERVPSTVVGPKLRVELTRMAATLGPYPLNGRPVYPEAYVPTGDEPNLPDAITATCPSGYYATQMSAHSALLGLPQCSCGRRMLVVPERASAVATTARAR